MGNAERVVALLAQMSEPEQGEVLDLAEKLAQRAAQRKATLDAWVATLEVEHLSPEEEARLEAIEAEGAPIPAEEVYRELGLI